MYFSRAVRQLKIKRLKKRASPVFLSLTFLKCAKKGAFSPRHILLSPSQNAKLGGVAVWRRGFIRTRGFLPTASHTPARAVIVPYLHNHRPYLAAPLHHNLSWGQATSASKLGRTKAQLAYFSRPRSLRRCVTVIAKKSNNSATPPRPHLRCNTALHCDVTGQNVELSLR